MCLCFGDAINNTFKLWNIIFLPNTINPRGFLSVEPAPRAILVTLGPMTKTLLMGPTPLILFSSLNLVIWISFPQCYLSMSHSSHLPLKQRLDLVCHNCFDETSWDQLRQKNTPKWNLSPSTQQAGIVLVQVIILHLWSLESTMPQKWKKNKKTCCTVDIIQWGHIYKTLS